MHLGYDLCIEMKYNPKPPAGQSIEADTWAICYVPSMDELREEIIQEGIPKDVMPELIGVSQYDDLTLIGELALCLQGLAAETK
jgi:hypothetical protein